MATIVIISLLHFLIYVCHGGLNKYFIPDNSTSNYSEAITKCKSFNTTLASIHASRDFNESKSLCSKFNNNDSQKGCYIGSVYVNESSGPYKWVDDTSFDFNKWAENAPESNSYVAMDPSNSYKWITVDENTELYAVCNMPSVLCDAGWIIQSGNVTANKDIVGCDVSIFGNGVSVIPKRWYNQNESIQIDYIYRMVHKTNETSKAGIIIEVNECNWYEVGVSTNGNISKLYIEHTNKPINEKLVIKDVEIDGELFESNYHLLSVVYYMDDTVGAIRYSISLNGARYLYGNHLNNYIESGRFSGYIGMFATNTIETTAKSLYISGTAIQNEKPTINKCNQTSVPTTQFSTRAPTSNPTHAAVIFAKTPTISTINPSETASINTTNSMLHTMLDIALVVLSCIVLVLVICGAIVIQKRRREQNFTDKVKQHMKQTFERVIQQEEIERELRIYPLDRVAVNSNSLVPPPIRVELPPQPTLNMNDGGNVTGSNFSNQPSEESINTDPESGLTNTLTPLTPYPPKGTVLQQEITRSIDDTTDSKYAMVDDGDVLKLYDTLLNDSNINLNARSEGGNDNIDNDMNIDHDDMALPMAAETPIVSTPKQSDESLVTAKRSTDAVLPMGTHQSTRL